jgi:ABC-type transporter Mla subunit MlaD
MTSDNLQNQYRDALADTLNQLQNLTLLIAQIESKMDDVRDSMQSLNQIMEEIVSSNCAD